MLLLVGVPDQAGLLGVIPGMVVTGLGTGLTVTPLTQLALNRVADERSGMASGVLQTARPIGVTVLGLAVTGHVDAAAFGSVAVIAAGLAVAAAGVSAVTIRRSSSS